MDIVITGTSRGIGKAIAEEAILKNHRVLAITTNEAAIMAGTYTYIMNPDKEPDVGKIHEIIEQYGFRPDALIHNAGAMINKAFEDVDYNDFMHVFRVNVWNPYRLTQIFLSYMNRGSHVVNIGSMGGFQGSSKFPGLSIYSASKAALGNVGECLAEELKSKEIAFNTLALGAVQTEMLEDAFPGYQALLMAQEIAPFILNFALEAHRFINGKIVPLSVSTP